MKQIPLTKGYFTKVDDCDYDFLMEWKWRYHKGYAARTTTVAEGRKWIYMHRLILDTPQGMETDHINEDGLDNQRLNLRICTHAQNRMNVGKYKGIYHSKYKGVTWHKHNKIWKAQIKEDGRCKQIGGFYTQEEAALAWNEAAIRVHGTFANLNEV